VIVAEEEAHEHGGEADVGTSEAVTVAAEPDSHEPVAFTQVDEQAEETVPTFVKPSRAWCPHRHAWVPVEVAGTPLEKTRPSPWAIEELKRQGVPIDPAWEANDDGRQEG
jgi:hypothetical protein